MFVYMNIETILYGLMITVFSEKKQTLCHAHTRTKLRVQKLAL